jgi:hypothetical protein
MKSKLFGLILIATLIFAVEMMTPAESVPCCSFVTNTTSTYSGIGSTCAAAKADWKNQANGEAICNCLYSEICTPTEVVTTACFWDNSCGSYRESGYFRYNCVTCP